MTRRSFLFGLIAAPVIAAPPVTLTIRPADEQRFHDEDALRHLLYADLLDMDVHAQVGLDVARAGQEDKLYAKICEDRQSA